MSDTERTEITKVMMIIREFLSETRNIVKNAEKSQQWLIQFRNTLCYQDLEDNPNKFALKLLAEARGFNDTQRRKQQTRWVRESLAKDGITNPSKQQLQERWMLIYGSEEGLSTATGNDQVPAGAPNGNNADESATAFENLGSPKPSTDGDTRKDSLNMATVRKNGALESGTSVEKFTSSQNDQRRTGGHLLPSSSLQKSPVRNDVDVLSLAYSGEFQNVKLTQEQYNQLGIRFGNQAKLNRAIDSLSCKIENGEKNPANHYAELVKWASYRDDMEEKEEIKTSSAPHYETVSEHNRRVLENGRKWIDEHFPKKESANG